MVVIYTLAYNAEKTLSHTIQSILDQTEQDWVWYLVDNGSVDTTGEIIRQSAAKDPRIVPLVNEQNYAFNGTWWWDVIWKHNESDWFCWQDADDTLSPTFLAEMLAFIQEESLDMAACGFEAIDALTGKVIWHRILPQNLILTNPQNFESYFTIYHQFMRTYWAKLFSIAVLRRCNWERMPPVAYGWDTLFTQEMLRLSGQFGILAKTLHQYYVSSKSVSYQWNSERIKADQILYQVACSYLLDKCGKISERNRNFLQAVYSNAVSDTTAVIQNAALSPTDKLQEYRTIAEHAITLTAYRECADESAERSRINLLTRTLEAGVALKKCDDTDFRAVMQALLPRCGQAVSAVNAQMFVESSQLLQALLHDDADTILSVLLERLQNNQGTKKYALTETIQALAVNNPLLCQINDAVFLRKYGDIYKKVWKENYLEALDEMAGLLMEDRVSGGRETLLSLFVALSALEEQVTAFLFGKFQLAWLFLQQGRRGECYKIISELTEMGVKDKELESLRQALEKEPR